MIQFYGYDKCGTCRKAEKVLTAKNVRFEKIDITQKPPAKSVLLAILKSGEYQLKELFNKSGEMYRALNMKEKIRKLGEGELVDLLAQNGRLVKRPIITDGKKATVGFDEEKLKKTWA